MEKGREEEEKGVHSPHWLCATDSGGFEGLHSPNMGFNFVTVRVKVTEVKTFLKNAMEKLS